MYVLIAITRLYTSMKDQSINQPIDNKVVSFACIVVAVRRSTRTRHTEDQLWHYVNHARS